MKGMKVGSKAFMVHLDGYDATFKEFPPCQKAGSFGIEQVLEKLTQGAGDK